MKKQRKPVYLDERGSHLLIYASLLVAAIFFAFRSPDQLWLSIGLGVGILYGLINDFLTSRKEKKTAEQDEKVSTKIEETVENKDNSDDKK
jgi:phosphotransferase system  glucose/maltose/N-acetylglucosamine-specific IIC component